MKILFLDIDGVLNSTDNMAAINVKAFVSGGHECNLLSTASCPPACTNAVLKL